MATHLTKLCSYIFTVKMAGIPTETFWWTYYEYKNT